MKKEDTNGNIGFNANANAGSLNKKQDNFQVSCINQMTFDALGSRFFLIFWQVFWN